MFEAKHVTPIRPHQLRHTDLQELAGDYAGHVLTVQCYEVVVRNTNVPDFAQEPEKAEVLLCEEYEEGAVAWGAPCIYIESGDLRSAGREFTVENAIDFALNEGGE
jgi:hypothetical protein